MTATIRTVLLAIALHAAVPQACDAQTAPTIPDVTPRAEAIIRADDRDERGRTSGRIRVTSFSTPDAHEEKLSGWRNRAANRDTQPRPGFLNDTYPSKPLSLSRRTGGIQFSAPNDNFVPMPVATPVGSSRLVTFSAPGDVPTAPGVVFGNEGAPQLIAQKPGTGAGSPDGQKIGEAPEETNASIQFLRQDSVLLKPGEYQFDVSVVYLHDEIDFALGQLVGNNLIIGEAKRRQRLLLVPIELRFGIDEDVQGFVNVPVGWSHSEFAFSTGNNFSNTSGLGDVSAGLTRLLYRGEGASGPQVLATLAFSAPTGNATFASSLTTPGSNLGLGFWTVTTGLTVIQTYDPLVIFYGGGYRRRFEETIDGFIVQPGDQVFYRFGVGFAVNPKVTLSASFFGSYIAQTKVNGVSIPGSEIEPMQIRLAATIVRGIAARSGNTVQTVEPFVMFGLTEGAVDTVIGVSHTY